jgi:hypothetical protein
MFFFSSNVVFIQLLTFYPKTCKGADHGGALVLGFGQLGAEAEIGDLDVADTVEEDRRSTAGRWASWPSK